MISDMSERNVVVTIASFRVIGFRLVSRNATGLPLNEDATGLPLNEDATGLPLNADAWDLPLNAVATSLPLNEDATGLPLTPDATGCLRGVFPLAPAEHGLFHPLHFPRPSPLHS